MSGIGATAGRRGYLPNREAAAVTLAALGAIVWGFESLTAWDKSTHPKFQAGTYIHLGAIELSTYRVLVAAMYSFGVVAGLLLLGGLLMIGRYQIGRVLVASACVLVLLGQTIVLILTLLRYDAFYSPPSSLATSELLMLCPLLALWCVAGRTRAVHN
ncbi:hypothetical protein [Nocardia sp. XZ_19_385]|uniref:hypothetical protein n=1 Tax=Nocardia sp. XZ_19_385 TaxID=2769488 RepID=UPI00188EED8E|nr:hypothetical protein [Nocardia sp. XZ_19_385]